MDTMRKTRTWVARRSKHRRSVLHEPGWSSPTLSLRRGAGQAPQALLPEPDPLRRPPPKRIIFVSAHNAGRSRMATAFFNQIADPARARAISAGTRVLGEVDPGVIQAMVEAGVELPRVMPRRLTGELAVSAGHLVTLGCLHDCPFFAGVRLQDWPLDDPREQPVERIREIRDEIRRRVVAMIEANGWGRSGGGE
jgi:arsenate reductase (thioredoxin)